MALADTANLIVQLRLDDKFSGPLRSAQGELGRLSTRQQQLGRLGEHIGQGIRSTITNVARIGAVAGGVLAVNIKAGVESLAELQRVEQLTATTLKSTGSAAAGSAADIRKRAQALEDLTTVDDKAIQNAENLLLSFRQIGEKAFDPTLKAALNLNAALGGDENSLQGVLIQVGKAVNDPIRGLTSLRRVGVSFSQEQTKRIQKLVDENRLYDAQKIIINELGKEFGGAAKAFGTGPAADMRRFGDAIEDAQQALATGFLPLISDISKRIQTALADPKVLANIRNLGQGLADAVDNLITIGTRLPWGAIGSAAKLMGEGAKGLLDAFTHLPSWIQTAVLTGWGLNKLTGGALGNILGDVIKISFPKLDLFSRGSPANPMFTKEVGLPGVGGPGGTPGSGVPGWLSALPWWSGPAAVGAALAVGFVASQNTPPDPYLPGGLAGGRGAGFGPQSGHFRPGAPNDPAVVAARAAQENNKQNVELINEAKASRLAIAHSTDVNRTVFHSLEQRLIGDKAFKPKIDSVEQFIRLLRRTSEFGKKGVGTAIEFGPKTGRDPVGDAFVALLGRLDKHTLNNGQVQGEITRHIAALEEVQKGLLKDGNVAEARHAQRNIDKLNALIHHVDDHVPHFRRIQQKINEEKEATQRGLSKVQANEAAIERYTGITSRKNFSPSFNANVYTTVNASLSTYAALQTITRVDSIRYGGKQIPTSA